MRRLTTGIWLCGTFVIAAAGARAQEPAAVLLTWSEDPSVSAIIQWQLHPGADIDHIDVRAAGGSWRQWPGDRVHFPFSERIVRRAVLRSLEPDHEYEVRFARDVEPYRFRTMPATLIRPVRFAAGGDTRSSMETFGRMNRVVAAFDPDFVMLGGDLAYSNGDPRNVAQEQQWFETLSHTLITDERRLIPVIATVGNHEVFYTKAFENDSLARAFVDHWGVRDGYATYFFALFPMPGPRGYGVLDVGDYLSILLLDSGHSGPVSGIQTDWLAEVLRERRGRAHIFPIYHVPAYPSVRGFDATVSRQIREHWVPLFEAHPPVRLVFENHDHAYKRTVPIRADQQDPAGVVYVGDGAWGVRPREIRRMQQEEAAWYLARARSENNAIIVTLDGSDQHIQVIDSDGNFIDEFSISAVPDGAVGSPSIR